MLTLNNHTDLDEYLIQNHRRNRKKDFDFFAKVGLDWDPLKDQNLDDSIVSLDPGQPAEKDTLVQYSNNHTKPKSERYSQHSYNVIKAKGKRGRARKEPSSN